MLKVDQNVQKTANKSALIHTNQILLSCNRLELSPMIYHTHFEKDWNYYEVKLHVKSVLFSTDNSQTPRLSIFTLFLTTKSLSQNISITLLQISLKLHEHRGRYWRKKLPWTIFEEQFPVPRYTAASKIGKSVISLLWQLRCRCNPDHNKFSSLSNTTVVAIFPKLCLWRRSLCSNLGGIGPEKLYRATLTNITEKVCLTLLHPCLGYCCLH